MSICKLACPNEILLPKWVLVSDGAGRQGRPWPEGKVEAHQEAQGGCWGDGHPCERWPRSQATPGGRLSSERSWGGWGGRPDPERGTGQPLREATRGPGSSGTALETPDPEGKQQRHVLHGADGGGGHEGLRRV